VNSGDSLTVYNADKNEHVRVFLPNIRAPTGTQAYSFESKELLRKKFIGQKVRV
jgi:hypothetical protein